MRAALRATAVLSGGTAVRVLAGVAVAKVWAVLVGPAGVGTLGLMQSAVGLVGIVASLGLGTGVVRLGAAALGRGDAEEATALARAALWASAAGGALAAVAVVAFRGPLGRALLDAPLGAADAAWLGAGVVLTVVTGAQLGVLNAHQRVGALARAAVWGSLAAAIAGVAVLWALRPGGLVEAYVVGLAATCAGSTWELGRAVGRPAGAPTWVAVRAAAGRLLRFGLPFTGSALVGTGVGLVLPVVVLHVLDVEAVGHYRAALSVSVGYLGFLLTAMAQDYYPRLSAAGDDRAALGRIVNEQLRLVLLVGGPVVLLAQATAVWIVPVIYAPSFAPAVPVLEWQLVGSLFKFWAWAFSFVILARSRSATFFLVEALGGALTLGATWVGVGLFGLVGSGVAFVAGYVLYALLVWALVRRSTGVAVAGRTLSLMATVSGVALAVQLMPLVGLGGVRAPVALALAAAVSAVCASALWRGYRSPAPAGVSA